MAVSNTQAGEFEQKLTGLQMEQMVLDPGTNPVVKQWVSMAYLRYFEHSVQGYILVLSPRDNATELGREMIWADQIEGVDPDFEWGN